MSRAGDGRVHVVAGSHLGRRHTSAKGSQLATPDSRIDPAVLRHNEAIDKAKRDKRMRKEWLRRTKGIVP